MPDDVLDKNRKLLIATYAAGQGDAGGKESDKFAEAGLSLVCDLLKTGADVNAQLDTFLGLATPLHYAARYNAKVVPPLLQALQEAGVDVCDMQHKAHKAATPLHWAARAATSAEMIPVLVQAGVDVRARDENGATPLHWAATVYNEKIVRQLLRHGACISDVNAYGRTPLTCALSSVLDPKAVSGALKCVELLMDATVLHNPDAIKPPSIAQAPIIPHDSIVTSRDRWLSVISIGWNERVEEAKALQRKKISGLEFDTAEENDTGLSLYDIAKEGHVDKLHEPTRRAAVLAALQNPQLSEKFPHFHPILMDRLQTMLKGSDLAVAAPDHGDAGEHQEKTEIAIAIDKDKLNRQLIIGLDGALPRSSWQSSALKTAFIKAGLALAADRIEKGANVNARLDTPSGDGFTPLQYAATFNPAAIPFLREHKVNIIEGLREAIGKDSQVRRGNELEPARQLMISLLLDNPQASKPDFLLKGGTASSFWDETLKTVKGMQDYKLPPRTGFEAFRGLFSSDQRPTLYDMCTVGEDQLAADRFCKQDVVDAVEDALSKAGYSHFRRAIEYRLGIVKGNIDALKKREESALQARADQPATSSAGTTVERIPEVKPDSVVVEGAEAGSDAPSKVAVINPPDQDSVMMMEKRVKQAQVATEAAFLAVVEKTDRVLASSGAAPSNQHFIDPISGAEETGQVVSRNRAALFGPIEQPPVAEDTGEKQLGVTSNIRR